MSLGRIWFGYAQGRTNLASKSAEELIDTEAAHENETKTRCALVVTASIHGHHKHPN